MSLTKSARQYHWSPFGYSASNALCSIGYGIGWTPCSSGSGSASSSGCMSRAAAASSPVWHQTTPHTSRRWISGGNGSPGGTVA